MNQKRTTLESIRLFKIAQISLLYLGNPQQVSKTNICQISMSLEGTESSMYIAFIESEFHLTALQVTNKRFLFDLV